MGVIQHIADALGGEVGVSELGRLEITQSLTPAKKTCSAVLPSGIYSVVMPEIEISDNQSELPNRVAYRCEVSWKQTVYAKDKNGNKKKTSDGKYQTKTETKKQLVIGRATVAKTSPLHHSSIGRWITKSFTCTWKLAAKGLNDSEALEKAIANVQENMNKKAASKLASLTVRQKSYVVKCPFVPIKSGQVVEFDRTSSGLTLHVQAMVESVDIEMGTKCMMTLNLKHVRCV